MLPSIRLLEYKIDCEERVKNASRSWSTPPTKSLTPLAILNPDHLFEQAERLIRPPAGRPRQVDVRRAISAAYYAIFHGAVTAAADEFIGVSNRDQSRYGLAYRSVNHAWLRDLCKEIQKSTLSSKFKSYAPSPGFDPNITSFAAAVVELQEKRHSADYDVMIRMNGSDAALAIAEARTALHRFGTASEPQRSAFLSLLLFPPR
jgi:uncharacterized protein (UPF0332 family)